MADFLYEPTPDYLTKMKNSHRLIALVTATLALASGAFADTLKLSQDTTNYSVGNGGAFIASDFTGSISTASYSSLALGDGGFLTYCIEYNEHFVPGGTYNYELSFGAKNGGVSGQAAGTNYDGISNATAWLYSEFAKGSLSSDVALFTYSHANLGDLQQAIWFLEGEGGTNNYLAAAAMIHEGANWNADNNGAYGVQALNLTYLNGGNAQDQLYYSVPDSSATIALLGLSLVGLASFRRKFRK